MQSAPGGVADSRQSAAGSILRAMRPLHWIKNLLVFVPLLMNHDVSNTQKLSAATLAFASFCLVASAAYVINDLIDREVDRHHPTKRHRPFATGSLSTASGVLMAVLLLIGGFGIALAGLSVLFCWMLLIYLILTLAYSLYLKRVLLIDVIVLAGLYTHREIAGGVAIGIELTPWLLGFSMFLFLSLAFAKRYAELTGLEGDGEAQIKGRGYQRQDMDVIASVGPASGYLSVLVLALYINSELARLQYNRPLFLWLVCPVLLYWITRVWFLARRRELHEDPIVFAVKDPPSWLAGALTVILVALAIGT